MTYQQALDYLFARLPMFSRIGSAAFKHDLGNTRELCAFLGNPQDKFKSVHVGGTNGKGSVSHMLATILQTAGFKVGLYTSPHLHDFRERIKLSPIVPGEMELIEADYVAQFTQDMQPLIERIEPSFFEVTVAMAFDYFSKKEVDIAIVEVGLGGRLDSTNIIRPELSVITNIGWDHMNILGDTLEKIAFEKAGIIKNEIPVVVGEWSPLTAGVFEKLAAEKNAPLVFASHKRAVTDWKWQKHELIAEVAEETQTDHQIFHLDLEGIYQTKNLLTVLESITQLKKLGWKIDGKSIHEGLRRVRKISGLQGRWDIVHYSPMLALDVAHNEDGIRQLVQQLELMEYHQLHIVIGLVKEKDVEKIIGLLPKDAFYYFTKAQIPRALPESELAARATNVGIKGSTYTDVNQAIDAAMQAAKPEDLIVVCGSVFIVGEVNRELFVSKRSEFY